MAGSQASEDQGEKHPNQGSYVQNELVDSETERKPMFFSVRTGWLVSKGENGTRWDPRGKGMWGLWKPE